MAADCSVRLFHGWSVVAASLARPPLTKVVRYVARVTLHTTKVGEWTEKSMASSSPLRLRFSTFVSRLISRRDLAKAASPWVHFGLKSSRVGCSPRLLASLQLVRNNYQESFTRRTWNYSSEFLSPLKNNRAGALSILLFPIDHYQKNYSPEFYLLNNLSLPLLSTRYPECEESRKRVTITPMKNINTSTRNHVRSRKGRRAYFQLGPLSFHRISSAGAACFNERLPSRL